MLKGFKDFILRGNVVEMAVAFVIGTAFAAVVKALVDGLVNPLIALFFNAKDLSTWVIPVTNFAGGKTDFGIGAVIGALITFIATAAVVYFLLVVPMNKFNERRAAKAGTAEAADEPATEQELLTQIRDLLEKQNGTSPRA